MSLIKNPEFKISARHSPDLRIARINFGSKTPVIAGTKTRMAIHEHVAQGLTDDIEAISVELKHRPYERLSFEVVSECPTEELAILLSLGLPMQAMRNAGVEIDRLVLVEEPSLVSGAGRVASVEAMLRTYDNLRLMVGGLATQGPSETSPTPLPASVPTGILLPEFAKAA